MYSLGVFYHGSLTIYIEILLLLLTDRVPYVGRYYGLVIELQNVPSKTANNFSVLVRRPVKFGMDNDYRLPYRISLA